MRRFIHTLNFGIILVLLLSGLSWRSGSANPNLDATISINPSSASVSNCGIADVYIDVNNVSNLYGLDLRLTFDPAVLEVVDFNPATPGVEIEPVIDPALNFTAGFTVRNVVNNFTGTIWYAATQINPTPPVNGSGHIAHISFRAKSSGSSAINFTFTQLADRNGKQITATSTNGSVSASTSVAPSLSISRLDTHQVQLSWLVAAGVSYYHLYRSITPYFYAADPAYQVLTSLAPGATQTFNDSVLGNVTTNYFYTLRAECITGGLSASAGQVGKFEYTLRETKTTDYTWIALPLNVTGLADSKDLANHIQANSSGAVTVLSVSKWVAASQQNVIYDHIYDFGNFSVSTKMPYRIEIDIPGVNSGYVIWAMVGSLPPITTGTYRLYQTAVTDYTWIMQPLDLYSITTSNDLANAIESSSSAPASVLTISRWNNSAQQNELYDHVYDYGFSDTRFGYPYRVEIGLSANDYVTWP